MSPAMQEDRLPVQQLAILSICRFAEPVALTNANPYLPEMIESFGVKRDEVAKWAGLTSAIFSAAQCLTAMLWVRASERFGRKPVILTSLACTMATTILLGFSQSLNMALIARMLGGAANGNVGIIRTAVAEMVPQKSLQPRAFSVMPLVWSIGSVFGPMLGGGLASPARSFPSIFGDSEFFKKYPFALPNLVASTLFVSGILIGLLFLKETMASRKADRDLGVETGKFLLSLFQKRSDRKTSWTKDIDQAAPLLKDTSRVMVPPVRASLRQVFSYQSSVNLLVYFLLAMHATASDQLIPVFLHLPHEYSDPALDSEGSFWKFNNGFGLDSGKIGRLFTIYALLTMLIQFSIFPPLARRFGVLPCLRACTLAFPLSYALMPFAVLMPTSFTRQLAIFLVMFIKGFAGIFAYPCNTILMTNSANTIPVLNTLNGVAVSVSAVGRALGPWVGGMTFSLGVETGWGILPWWMLSAVAMAGHVSTWWLVEGEGIKAESEAEADAEPGSSGLSSSVDVADGEDEDEDEELLDKLDQHSNDRATATAFPGSSSAGGGEKEKEKEEEFKLLAEDDMDMGTTAQHAATLGANSLGVVGSARSHAHTRIQNQHQHQYQHSRKSSIQLPSHGEDPELALGMEMQVFVSAEDDDDDNDAGGSGGRRPSRADTLNVMGGGIGGGGDNVRASGVTLEAPALKPRLRSPMGRRKESLA